MPGFDTYTQLRQAEDVQDEIYIISPVDNPVASMGRTIRATGKLHEWTEDKLQAAEKNAAVEGADAPASSEQPVIELNNFCQIMTKTAHVTGTLEEVDKYGRDSEMAYQLELRYGELANDEELAIAGAPGGTRQTKIAGDAVTAREMASLHNQLSADVVEDATGFTTVAELEAGLLAAHLACYTAGGNPSYLMTNPANAQYISSFAYTSGRQRDIRNERRLVNVIDLYVSHYGELDVVMDRNQDSCFLGLDFNYFATPVLRATRDWPIAKAGDSDKRQILRESTNAVLNIRAHFMVDNIPAGLTVT
ncbi:MAG: DUF5309 family protein [Woeseiaceae bacterium]|nr:DUF5309 family protein [Woeseiaceae bacterium]